MDWDRERYRRDVMDPARRSGNVPPPDLYVRYGLPPGLSDPALFAEHIAAVTGYWRELASHRTYGPLARALIAAHGTLERSGRLTLRRFAERQAHARQETAERLRRLAETEAGAATHAGPATVTRLRDAAGGGVSDAEVAGALRQAGVRVVRDFPPLSQPHPKQADLARYLTSLGRSLSAEVVFGDAVPRGFRILDGFRLAGGQSLDTGAIAAARGRVDALPYTDPAKAASENVLAILRTAARQPGELDALLLSEVVEPLRQLARAGFLQRAIASQAAELGLDEDEAGLIAAAVLAPGTLEALRQQITNELAAGRLRGAQRLEAGLPAADPLHERLAALDAEVSELSRRAGAERDQGQSEQAARLLAQALNLARDDTGLSGQLAALPPPPPRQVAARLDGDHVVVTWAPVPELAGRVHYRVRRGQDVAPASPDEGTPVDGIAQHRAEDTGAPPGAELIYSVFAGRDGQAWSPAAVTPPVTFAPDVTRVSVLAADTSVAVSWQPHPGADRILVIRDAGRAPRGPEEGTPVESALTGFTDTGLRTGTEYYYRIVTVYRTAGGQRRLSAGVVERAVPEPRPEAVTDLDVTGPVEGAVVARWTPPPYGQVRLAIGGKPPPWAAGTLLRPGETARLPVIKGAPRRGPDGREALEVRLPPGHHYLLALTMGRDVSVVGQVTEVRLAETVRDLTARRMHDDVRLGWVWPSGATDALVRWPGGEHRCSRRVYDDEGGVAITTGPGETVIEVRALFPLPGGSPSGQPSDQPSGQPSGRFSAPAARVRVPARGVAVHYRIRRASRWHPRQRLIELSAERETRLPALVVVQSVGPYAPDDPAEGETVHRAGPQPIAPGQPVTIAVEVTARPVWLACFADPGNPGQDPILLFPPPAEEMRVR